MSDGTSQPELATTLERVTAAVAAGKLSASAAENIQKWLTESRYAGYVDQVVQHIVDENWQKLDDVFWTVIPFGTGGRRGRMYPIGSNAINDRTIGESARGLAEYVLRQHDGQSELSCALAYDTRINSRHFAELCAGIMVAAGFRVYFLDDFRSTPELSFLVRHKKCTCGIMVTASHNPPSDNAVKVYWSTGGQVLPPHDQTIIDQVMNVQEIPQADFDQAVADGKVIVCTDETDAAYQAAVLTQRHDGPRDLKIIYSPLHGVGASAVRPVLEADGFTDLEVFEPHAEPNGNFPNVPGHVSNPENAKVFDAIIRRGEEIDADLILATDPDCDRMGCASPRSLDANAPWHVFTGNQIGALLTEYVLQQRPRLSSDHYLVKTLVTTEMVRRIGESYGLKTCGDLLVGFKWIGGVMDQQGADKFVLGLEESHGYLAGQYARDKDGPLACMLMAELAASARAAGKTVYEKLDDLYWQHGYHAERLLSVQMEGSEGMSQMQTLMARFRESPPQTLAGIPVGSIRDYKANLVTATDGSSRPLEGPTGDLVMIDLAEDGNYVAVRPSGTEPKVKFYMFTFIPAEQLADLDQTKKDMEQRLDGFERDLREFAKLSAS
jgi:phosphoglucomutase/phosphomannomutase